MTDEARIPYGVEATPGVLVLYEQFGPSYRWWVAIVSMIGSFATLLTSTIVNVAIPDIMGALGLTLDQAQWLATAFLAAGTVTMLMTAWSIRAFGVANTYTVSMLVFIGGSVLGALADTGDILFLSRIIQGAAAGMVMPISMVMISQAFPLQQRGMAMGFMGVGTILAPALGPTIGGYLVDNLSWRWVFVVAIPFVVVSLPMATTFFPQREEKGAKPPFDWIGAFLCSLFLVTLLVALTDAQRHGVVRRACGHQSRRRHCLIRWLGGVGILYAGTHSGTAAFSEPQVRGSGRRDVYGRDRDSTGRPTCFLYFYNASRI